jgi:MFS family permease
METYNTGVEKFKSFKRHVSRWVKNPVDLVEQYHGKKFSKDFYLHLISYFISLNGFLYGFFMTQSNILLLLSNDNHRNNSKDLSGYNHQNETTLTSEYITILYIGALVGAFFSFPFVDNFGRKKTLIAALVCCFFMIFWTLITISDHNLYYSRFFMGISLGFMMTIAPLYIAEVRKIMFFSVR